MGEQQTQSVCDQPQDIRGSVTSIINRNYYPNKYYTYDEFGKAEEKGDANFINENTFTGAIDEGDGIYYMNARFYNANTGRFLSQDTYKGNAWEPWSQNLYSYCGNNPINMIDPTGHWPEWNKLAGGSSLLLLGAMVMAVGLTIATAGAATPLIAVVATMGATAGAATMMYGGAEIVESFTGENYIRDEIYNGDEKAYETGKFITTISGIVLTGAAAIAYTAAMSAATATATGSTSVLTSEAVQFSDKFYKSGYIDQVARRGWTSEMIANTFNNPVKIVTGFVNSATGNSATYYYIDEIHYVAFDDITGKVIQVADLLDSLWK